MMARCFSGKQICVQGFSFFDSLTATGIHFWFLWTIPSHIVSVLVLGLAWQVKQCKTKPIISSLMEWRCITSNHLLVKYLRTCLQQTDLQCFNVQTGSNPDKCLFKSYTALTTVTLDFFIQLMTLLTLNNITDLLSLPGSKDKHLY